MRIDIKENEIQFDIRLYPKCLQHFIISVVEAGEEGGEGGGSCNTFQKLSYIIAICCYDFFCCVWNSLNALYKNAQVLHVYYKVVF